jgi:hypothetical protein
MNVGFLAIQSIFRQPLPPERLRQDRAGNRTMPNLYRYSMEKKMITPKDASNLFMDRVLIDLYHEVYKYLQEAITEGLPGRVDDPNATENWYRNLADKDKLLLNEIIQSTIKETIFSFLTILDNVSGGFPIQGQDSDFALYIQTYRNGNDLVKNKVLEAVRFNSLADEELHSLFLNRIEEEEEEN